MSDQVFDDYNQCVLNDIRGSAGNNIKAEINFSKSEGHKDCVRLTLDGKTAIIPIKELHGLVWSVADAEQRDRLTPVTMTTIRKIKKLHKVEVKKDIKKGDFLNVRCETSVPVEVYEGLKGMLDKKPKTTVPIIGRI